jgi:uncharacterized protein YutD
MNLFWKREEGEDKESDGFWDFLMNDGAHCEETMKFETEVKSLEPFLKDKCRSGTEWFIVKEIIRQEASFRCPRR